MKSWEILRDAAEKIGVKALASKLNLSAALVYKWCQESPDDDPDASGARNPLDRVASIYEATRDQRLVNWICHEAGGFFVANPTAQPGDPEKHLLGTTQRLVDEFGQLLSTVSRSIQNDGQITTEEARHIRQSWEDLKMVAEPFVIASERGLYARGRSG